MSKLLALAVKNPAIFFPFLVENDINFFFPLVLKGHTSMVELNMKHQLKILAPVIKSAEELLSRLLKLMNHVHT